MALAGGFSKRENEPGHPPAVILFRFIGEIKHQSSEKRIVIAAVKRPSSAGNRFCLKEIAFWQD